MGALCPGKEGDLGDWWSEGPALGEGGTCQKKVLGKEEKVEKLCSAFMGSTVPGGKNLRMAGRTPASEGPKCDRHFKRKRYSKKNQKKRKKLEAALLLALGGWGSDNTMREINIARKERDQAVHNIREEMFPGKGWEKN